MPGALRNGIAIVGLPIGATGRPPLQKNHPMISLT
jgi:hypothetical protein